MGAGQALSEKTSHDAAGRTAGISLRGRQERLQVRATAKGSTLLRSLGLAHHWQRLLNQGKFGLVTEIVALKHINLGQASWIYRLAQLVPDLVEGMAQGRLDVCLTYSLQQTNREQRGPNSKKRAVRALRRGNVFKRALPETAPTLGK
ncbi:MAG: hypothetical protein LBU72_09435 [Burkholderiaceae bacterium]|nr:hypothetical protein [Burkholderiaceae bacterium]